eukprot:SAG22_NODE_5304_length_1041_cov_0.984076_2_plen_94_part_00
MNGSLWFADIEVTDTALVNVVRRDGAPLKVYDPTTGNTFVEGKDYAAVSGANTTRWVAGGPAGTVQLLPESTTLRPGQQVLIDYYAVSLGACA